MDFEKACDILEIDYKDANVICNDLKQLKRKYINLALKYHPDKNANSSDCTLIFQEIQEAYEFLRNNRGCTTSHDNTPYPDYETNIPSYTSIIRTFFGTVDDPTALKYMDVVLDKILLVCEKQAISMIDGLSERKFMEIYNLVTRYRHVFHLTPDFFEAMEKKRIFWFDQSRLKKRRVYDSVSNPDDIIQDESDRNRRDPDKIKKYRDVVDSEWGINYQVEVDTAEPDELELEQKKVNDQNVFLLHPSIEDLWNQNVYQCTRYGQTFLIPLWHHELVYDVNGKELLVEIKPKLPNHYWIDEDNNLHKIQEYTMSELWDGVVNEKGIHVFFGTKRFVFYPHKLLLKTHQVWTWEKQGIPEIREDAIYDISSKKDVILHIHITGLY